MALRLTLLQKLINACYVSLNGDQSKSAFHLRLKFKQMNVQTIIEQDNLHLYLPLSQIYQKLLFRHLDQAVLKNIMVLEYSTDYCQSTKCLEN